MNFTKEIEYVAVELSLKYVPTNRIQVYYEDDELRKGSPFRMRSHVKASKTMRVFPPVKN